MRARPAPVSYTHLDVYKRQVLDIGLRVNKVEKLEFQATPTAVNRDCKGYYLSLIHI